MKRSHRLDVIMSDIIPLYNDFLKFIHQGDEVTMEEFERMCDTRQIEYLHYIGSSVHIPFHDDVEEDLVQLAAAYMYLPKSTLLAHVQLFSLLLLSYFFGTQPVQDNNSLNSLIPIKISADVLESVLDHSTSRQRLTQDIILTLYDHSAFSIQPYVDNREYIAAVIRAHELYRAPIFQKAVNERFEAPARTGSALKTIDHSVLQIGDTGLQSLLMDYIKKRELLNTASFT